jgi:hypothetical protein
MLYVIQSDILLYLVLRSVCMSKYSAQNYIFKRPQFMGFLRVGEQVSRPYQRECKIILLCVLVGSAWWPGLNNSPTVTHARRKRRLKWLPSAWGYSWATLSPGVINTEVWSSRLGVGRWTNNPAL